MMKNSKKLIIIYPPIISLYLLCIPKLCSSAQCCEPRYCNNNYRTSIEFPFRVRDDQPVSCGCRGFDLYCDNKLGLLLELPSAGNFTVDYIYYNSKELKISDPNGCLTKKLLNLNLTRTPFRGINRSVDHQVYNCSGGIDYPFDSYDKIKCLSGSDYTVVSNASSFATMTDYPNCSFLKHVSVPAVYDDDYYNLSDIKSIYLNWNEQNCKACVPDDRPVNTSKAGGINNRVAVVLGCTVPIAAFILVTIICFSRSHKRPRVPYWIDEDHVNPTSPTSSTNDQPPNTSTSGAPTPSSPDHQNTIIDSYPYVIPSDTYTNTNFNTSAPTSSGLDPRTLASLPIQTIGEHGDLTNKPDNDDLCSICWCEYCPKEIVKRLPHCLHRFHVACIDEWLISHTTCPICRTSLANNLTNNFHI